MSPEYEQRLELAQLAQCVQQPCSMSNLYECCYFFVETVLERCKVQYFVQPIHINEHRPNMNTSLGQFRQGLSIVAFIKGGFIAKLLYVGLH